jgi:hypothetical protein
MPLDLQSRDPGFINKLNKLNNLSGGLHFIYVIDFDWPQSLSMPAKAGIQNPGPPQKINQLS